MYLRGPEVGLQRDCSETTAREIDEEVDALLDEAYSGARQLLESDRESLETLARTLLEHETLDREAFERLLARPPRAAGGAL
jgi:cell division protease FtsH